MGRQAVETRAASRPVRPRGALPIGSSSKQIPAAQTQKGRSSGRTRANLARPLRNCEPAEPEDGRSLVNDYPFLFSLEFLEQLDIRRNLQILLLPKESFFEYLQDTQ